MGQLEGKVAIVTGAAQGMGACEARRMAELLEISAKHRLLEEREAS